MILLNDSDLITNAIPKVLALGIQMKALTVYGETHIGIIIAIINTNNQSELIIINKSEHRKLIIVDTIPIKLIVVFDELLVVFQGTRIIVFNILENLKQISSVKHAQLYNATQFNIMVEEDTSNHIIYIHSIELVIISFNLLFLLDNGWVKTTTLYNVDYIHFIINNDMIYYIDDMVIIGPHIYIQLDGSYGFNGIDYSCNTNEMIIIYEIDRIHKQLNKRIVIDSQQYFTYKNSNIKKSIINAWYDGNLKNLG